MDKWVCLAISSAFHHGNKDAAAREIQNIFGDSLVEARIVRDNFMEQSGEYFMLVKCSDYHSHIDQLRDSPAVLRVVQSYNEPSFLTEEEVDGFSQSVNAEPPPVEFIYGDIVQVQAIVSPKNFQYLSGLYGMVVEPMLLRNRVSVFFRFETYCFSKSISSTSLRFAGNVFENMKVPPFKGAMRRSTLFWKTKRPMAKEAVENIVSRDKIRRKQRRTRERPYSR